MKKGQKKLKMLLKKVIFDSKFFIPWNVLNETNFSFWGEKSCLIYGNEICKSSLHSSQANLLHMKSIHSFTCLFDYPSILHTWKCMPATKLTISYKLTSPSYVQTFKFDLLWVSILPPSLQIMSLFSPIHPSIQAAKFLYFSPNPPKSLKYLYSLLQEEERIYSFMLFLSHFHHKIFSNNHLFVHLIFLKPLTRFRTSVRGWE